MTTNFTDIDTAINTGFYDLSLGYPVKFSGLSMPKKTDDEPWIRVTPMYARTVNMGLKNFDVNNGVLQVDVFVKSGEADTKQVTKQIVDEVLSALPKNQVGFTSNGIKVRLSNIGVGAPQEDDVWYKTMITANFQAFTDRL